MNIDHLPTTKAWSNYDWEAVLADGSTYSDVWRVGSPGVVGGSALVVGLSAGGALWSGTSGRSGFPGGGGWCRPRAWCRGW